MILDQQRAWSATQNHFNAGNYLVGRDTPCASLDALWRLTLNDRFHPLRQFAKAALRGDNFRDLLSATRAIYHPETMLQRL
jgi:hypothetical protein